MDFVDGPQNDVVLVFVDGSLAHTGTSWEDYFRDCEGNETRTVDSLLFRSSGTAAPANAWQGLPDRQRRPHVGGLGVLHGLRAERDRDQHHHPGHEPRWPWFAADILPGGQLVFDVTYGGSLGDGAAILSTNSGTAKVQLFTDLFGASGGTALADIDAIAYSTYRDTAPVGSPASPALNLRVDAPTTSVASTPIWSTSRIRTSATAPCTTTNGRPGTPSGMVPASGGPRNTVAIPGCGQATPCTWSAIVAAHPDARVVEPPASPTAPGSLGINLGSGNPSVTVRPRIASR